MTYFLFRTFNSRTSVGGLYIGPRFNGHHQMVLVIAKAFLVAANQPQTFRPLDMLPTFTVCVILRVRLAVSAAAVVVVVVVVVGVCGIYCLPPRPVSIWIFCRPQGGASGDRLE